jgi:DDE superfamily endonuclease
MTPFEGSNLTVNESLFNKRMSKARLSVEWAFKDVKNTSRILHFHERWFYRERQVVLGIWQAVCSGISDAA